MTRVVGIMGALIRDGEEMGAMIRAVGRGGNDKSCRGRRL